MAKPGGGGYGNIMLQAKRMQEQIKIRRHTSNLIEILVQR